MASSKAMFLSCEICMEGKSRDEMFDKNKCSHSFCSDCISKHIAAKIHQNINSVTCPGLNCRRVLEPEECRSLVPADLFDRWRNALCESLVFRGLNADESASGREDIMLMELAKANNWNRCPSCRFYVEKIDGCLHITCRCGSQFCYYCGATWSDSHGGCQRV